VETDPEIAKTLSSISKLYFDKGEYKASEEMQAQALNIIVNQFGKKHPLYARYVIDLL
jgi:hypothetical protein